MNLLKREAKHRQNMEEQIDSIQHDAINPSDNVKLDENMEKRILKIENSLAETRKDLKKERKRLKVKFKNS